MMTLLLNFGGSMDFEKQLEIQSVPPQTTHWLASVSSLLALDPGRWSDLRMAVGSCYVSKMAVGRRSVFGMAVKPLTPPPAPLLQNSRRQGVYKRDFRLFLCSTISDLQNAPNFSELLHLEVFFQSFLLPQAFSCDFFSFISETMASKNFRFFPCLFI